MTMPFPDLWPALPEVILLVVALILLMVGVFGGSARNVTWIAMLGLAAALAVVVSTPGEVGYAFGGLFVTDAFARFMKALVLIGSLTVLFMSEGYRAREAMGQFEFPILIVFATLGMLMMVSANDLMSLYLGLELQSLPLYVIAAFKRDSAPSTEAGLKYFILGALSSGMLLYGCSMIYGFTGHTDFAGIAEAVAAHGGDLGILVGFVFLLSGLAFKISSVPFHMWTPDVYEGSPTAVTAFFAAAPKIAAVALLLRVVAGPFGDMTDQWQQVIVFLSVASMVLGAFAAVWQTNIKRLMAYSSIGNIGYALIGLAAGTFDGIQSVIIYMSIYLVMTVGTFGCILAMRVRGEAVESISDLAGLADTNKPMATALAILMLSLAGIPPLGGFFGKLYVFRAAIESELYVLAIVGLLTSVVGAFYYLRIIRLMWFDAAKEPLDRPVGHEITAVVGVASLLMLFLFLRLGPLESGSATAAAALFP